MPLIINQPVLSNISVLSLSCPDRQPIPIIVPRFPLWAKTFSAFRLAASTSLSVLAGDAQPQGQEQLGPLGALGPALRSNLEERTDLTAAASPNLPSSAPRGP